MQGSALGDNLVCPTRGFADGDMPSIGLLPKHVHQISKHSVRVNRDTLFTHASSLSAEVLEQRPNDRQGVLRMCSVFENGHLKAPSFIATSQCLLPCKVAV